MAQHCWGRREFLSMLPLVFESKRLPRFSLRANFSLTIALQVVNRQTVFWKYTAPFYGQRLSTASAHKLFGYMLPHLDRQEFSQGLLTQTALSFRGEEPFPRPQEVRSKKTTSGTGADVFTSGFAEPLAATSSKRTGKNLSGEYHRYERPNLSGVNLRHKTFPLTVMSSTDWVTRRDSEERPREWATRRYLPLQAILKSRHETLQVASASPLIIRSTSKSDRMASKEEEYLAGALTTRAIRKRENMAAKAETNGLFFQRTENIKHEIDDLKKSLRKTEDRINERVVRRLKEVVKEQIPPVDVSGLSLQVYRNIERMIRTERERRGM